LFGKGKNSMLALSNSGKVYCYNMWKYEKDYKEAILNPRFKYEGIQDIFLK